MIKTQLGSSNQIHWLRRIETNWTWHLSPALVLLPTKSIDSEGLKHPSLQIRQALPNTFQPNPLTQKDWNLRVKKVAWTSWSLPTKSIDSEGLKPNVAAAPSGGSISFQPNPLTQKDWNIFNSATRDEANKLPTKSIDSEGLKLRYKKKHPTCGKASNQIHWLRRIETSMRNWKLRTVWFFQPNPLTQKDWNLLELWMGNYSEELPTKSIDSEGLKQVGSQVVEPPTPPSNQIHWLRRIETIFNTRDPYTSNLFQPNPLTQKDWNWNISSWWHSLDWLPTKSIDSEGLKQIAQALPELTVRDLPTKSIDSEGLKLTAVFFRSLSFWFLPTKSIDSEGLKRLKVKDMDHSSRTSNQIHWLRRIETRHSGNVHGVTEFFQPNPLTQKDWNAAWPSLSSSWPALPTKSIDSEGLKRLLSRFSTSLALIFQPNPLTQKDWNVNSNSNPWIVSELPTKSIDSEGLKLVGDWSRANKLDPSNQIHWLRRIETAIVSANSFGYEHFQPNPLTQKDWNSLLYNLTRPRLNASNQIHWLRRIETMKSPVGSGLKSSFQPNPLTQKDWNIIADEAHIGTHTLPTKSIDSEGLKRNPSSQRVWRFWTSNQIHWLRRIETTRLLRGDCPNWSFQPNPLTQKDWNNLLRIS